MPCKTRFQARLAHQPDAALGQVSKPAVEQAADAAGEAKSYCSTNRCASAHGGVAGNTRTDDSSADHQHVQRLRSHAVEHGSRVVYIRSSAFHLIESPMDRSCSRDTITPIPPGMISKNHVA